MSDVAVRVEHQGAVAVVHVDDGKVNALSFELIAAIKAEVEAADADDSIGAVVVHGRDGKFSAGFDLGVMMSGDVGSAVRLVADGGDLVRTLYGSGVPVVAACTGHALAAGALMLLGCDVRIGADAPAKIGLNEVAIKLVLPRWALTIAGERLSRRHVQRAILNARITGPAEAVDVGFLDDVVAPDVLLESAIGRAAELAATLDPAAYRDTVREFRGRTLDTMDAQIAADRAAGAAVADSMPATTTP